MSALFKDFTYLKSIVVFWLRHLFLFSLFCFLSSILYSQEKSNFSKPGQLTVNFLLHPDLALYNAYPVNIPLHEAVNRNENFQFVEIKNQQPLFGWELNSSKNNTLQTAYRIIVASSLENALCRNVETVSTRMPMSASQLSKKS